MHMITDKKNKRKMRDIFLFKIQCMHFPRLLHPVTKAYMERVKKTNELKTVTYKYSCIIY